MTLSSDATKTQLKLTLPKLLQENSEIKKMYPQVVQMLQQLRQDKIPQMVVSFGVTTTEPLIYAIKSTAKTSFVIAG